MDISIDDDEPERVVFELFAKHYPLTAENFRALCTGEKGMGLNGKPLYYKVCEKLRTPMCPVTYKRLLLAAALCLLEKAACLLVRGLGGPLPMLNLQPGLQVSPYHPWLHDPRFVRNWLPRVFRALFLGRVCFSGCDYSVTLLGLA